jgi:uncharacterized membrane protein
MHASRPPRVLTATDRVIADICNHNHNYALGGTITVHPHLAATPPLLTSLSLVSFLLGGAIFGFFHAWICSTMWGHDAADPAIAIAAMQAKNASAANAVFAPALFGTPVVLSLTALVAWLAGRKGSAKALLDAGIVYSFGGLGATMAVNVP